MISEEMRNKKKWLSRFSTHKLNECHPFLLLVFVAYRYSTTCCSVELMMLYIPQLVPPKVSYQRVYQVLFYICVICVCKTLCWYLLLRVECQKKFRIPIFSYASIVTIVTRLTSHVQKGSVCCIEYYVSGFFFI